MTDSDDPLLDIFCNAKPAKALIYLQRKDRSHAREISDAINTTYSHAVRLLARLNSKGLMEHEKKGRKKEYELTENGEALAANLFDLIETCADLENMSVDELLRPETTDLW